MTGIKPTVLEDVAAIVEKFPCESRYVPMFLEDFVSYQEFNPINGDYNNICYVIQWAIIDKLQTEARIHQRPITACLSKEPWDFYEGYELSRNGRSYSRRILRSEIEGDLEYVGLVLSTRLMDEQFRGLIDFERAAVIEKPADGIQRAFVC